MSMFSVLTGLSVLFLMYLTLTYNRLVKKRNLLKEAWSGIDVQLKRRHDLIPNLVEIVKGYAAHERNTLEEVVTLRGQSEAAQTPGALAAVENTVSRDLRKLIALAEAYPDLKAQEGFLQFQAQLSEIEDHLQYARRYYNGTVRDLNILVESFPSSIVAAAAGFRTEEFFKIETVAERSVPEVDF